MKSESELWTYCFIICVLWHRKGYMIWKLKYQEPLEGKFIEMCTIHWMQEHEIYQWVLHTNRIGTGVSEEHCASILVLEGGSLETCVHYYRTTQHDIPEDSNLHCHHQINKWEPQYQFFFFKVRYTHLWGGEIIRVLKLNVKWEKILNWVTLNVDVWLCCVVLLALFPFRGPLFYLTAVGGAFCQIVYCINQAYVDDHPHTWQSSGVKSEKDSCWMTDRPCRREVIHRTLYAGLAVFSLC